MLIGYARVSTQEEDNVYSVQRSLAYLTATNQCNAYKKQDISYREMNNILTP